MTSGIEHSQVREPQRWNDALRQLPVAHVLQSWEWGAFKERHGWQAAHWLWTEDGEPRAAALVLSRSARPLPARILYAPKGPLLDPTDRPLLERVLGDMEGLARAQRAWFLKVDPDVRTDRPAGEAFLSTIAHRGWRASPEQIQFRNTFLLDLTPEPDDILADMKSKWRYNVRLAGRRGVKVREGGMDDLPLLYDMYRETSQRHQFVIRPKDYYRDAWGSFIEAGLARPLIAEVEGEAVAMVIMYRFATRAWYMYGASRDLHRDCMPNHRLQWEAILWARAQGCTVYDMWGAPDVLDESDPLWGVYRFKKGFGAEFVRHVGAYDYVVSGLGYGLYTRVMPRVLEWMRQRHWRRE